MAINSLADLDRLASNKGKQNVINDTSPEVIGNIKNFLGQISPKMNPGINMATGMMSMAYPGKQGEMVQNLPQVMRGTERTTPEYISQEIGKFLPGIEGGGNSGLPVAAGKVAGKAVNALRPSSLLRGNLSKEELQANLEAAQGTNTSLGDIIGSPTLKRIYENVLPNIPFSGAYTKMQQTANKLTEKGEDLLNKIGEKLPEGDKTQLLQDALKKASSTATKEKNLSFEKPNKIAEKIGLVVPRTKFQYKAQEILQDIDKSPELKREFPSELMKDIQEYAKGSEGNNLKLSNIFKGKLGEKKNELFLSGKKYESGLIRELQEALGEDIEHSINNANNPELKAAHAEAQKNYGTKFKPFEHPDILKFTREGGDPDLMLSHFLKTGANDRGELIGRLTEKLPKDLQNLPLHMYLSRAVEDGKLNPVKLNTLYGKLGEKQREALISDKAIRKELEKYTRGINLNKEAFQTMVNTKTGQRNLDSLIGGMEAMAGYNLGGIGGALASIPAMGLGGRLGTKALTSEAIRNALVKKMINKP